jgi:FtsH-binding integral membrane protein
MTFSLAASQLVLAAGSGTTTTNQPGGQGQEFGSSSPVALIVIIALFIAVAFLIRSMSKHLKRVPASFDPADEAGTPASDQEKHDS